VIRQAAAIVGLLLAVMFALYWWRGPMVRVGAQPLKWVRLSREPLRVVHSTAGIDFLNAPDLALRRANEVAPFPGLRGFHLVDTYDGTLWALASGAQVKHVETFVLFTSSDKGATFVAHGPIHAPTSGALLEGWIIRGNEIALNFVGPGPVADAWRWPWWGTGRGVSALLGPSVGQRSVLRSKNGGRSWRLER
jgi:hypothetical protein